MADFWSHVDKAGPLPPKRPDLGPCWIWTAAIDKQTGYGKVGDEVEDGNLVIVDGVARVKAVGDVGPFYRPHWASCAEPAVWRR